MPKSNHPAAIQRRRQRNSSRPCLVPGCPSPRNGLSGFCGKHTQRVALYGHPNGKRLTGKEYSYEHTEAAAFTERHMDHPGIVSALAWLRDWLRDASAGLNVPARVEFHRLNTSNVSALDIFTEAVAVWLYASRNPSRIPSGPALSCALGTCVLYLTPRFQRERWTNGERSTSPERICGSKRRAVGDRIRNTLGALFINIEKALQAEHEAAIQQRHALSAPFTPPTNP